jgi:hypothetical protein
MRLRGASGEEANLLDWNKLGRDAVRLPRVGSMISILHADGEGQLFPRCHFGLRLG